MRNEQCLNDQQFRLIFFMESFQFVRIYVQTHTFIFKVSISLFHFIKNTQKNIFFTKVFHILTTIFFVLFCNDREALLTNAFNSH